MDDWTEHQNRGFRGRMKEFTGAYGDHWHEMLQVMLTEVAQA